MDLCPHCQTPASFDKVTDGRCPNCGMALPVEGETGAFDPVVVETPVGTVPAAHTLVPSVLPSGEQPTIQLPQEPPAADDDSVSPRGVEFIRPRKLSPQYERQVTAAWQNTISQIKEPGETIRPEDGAEKLSAEDAEKTRQEKAGAETTILGSGPSELEELTIGLRVLGKAGDPGPKDYEIKDEKPIGEGGMGIVWSARQASLNRDVAIKTPKRQEAGTVAGRRRFTSEVVITGQLDHPNIVPIYDLGRDASGELFYAMKQVIGRPWSELLENEEKTLQENLEILMKVCDAIRFAHDRGVIHRDIKPENVMIGQYGEVAVMDWGIALRMDFSTSGLAPAQSGGGTPQYMAPEMATGSIAAIGPATDVYLLGAVLYEILTGYPPHPAPAPSNDLRKRINEALLIAARNLITPIEEGGELADIAYKALATDMENRYQGVKDFQDAVRDYHSHVESINLTERGEKLLERARKNGHAPGNGGGRFDDFDRARFAFEEALQIWPSNRVAHTHHAEALVSYAEYAFDEGAYARGIALLSESNPDHKVLLRKLKAARRRTNSLSMLLKGAAILIIVGGGVFTYFLDQARNKAELAKNNAVAAQVAETAAKEDALSARDDAVKAKDAETLAKESAIAAQMAETQAKEAAIAAQMAETQAKERAIAAQEAETKAKELAVAAQNDAQRSSYAFEIGLAAEELQRNAFDRVREIVDSQQKSSTKNRLINWEWGYLKALVGLEANSFSDRGELLKGRVETTAISKDKKHVAAGTNDGDVYLWRFDANERPVRLRYGEAVISVAITNDSSTLLAAGRSEGQEHAVMAWKLPATENAEIIATHDKPILSLDVSSDSSSVLAGTADGTVLLLNLNDSNKSTSFKATSQVNGIWSARFSPDDKWIVTAGEDGTVRVWQIENDDSAGISVREVQRYQENEGPVYAAAFAPNGQYLVFGGQDRRLLAMPFDPEKSRGTAYSPSATVRSNLSGEAEIIRQSAVVPLGAHEATVRSISFAPDGNVLFSAGHDHTIRVWDTKKGLEQAKLAKTLRGHGGWVRSCVALPDDTEQVLSGAYDGRVRIWDWNKYNFPLVLRQESQRSLGDLKLTAGAASTDGEWVASASSSGVITIWDMSNPSEPKPFELAEGHDWQATTGVYFAGGQRLLTAGGDNTALVWDEEHGNEILRIGGRDAKEGAGWRGVAAVTSDGRHIATGAQGKILARIWDANSGEPVAPIATPTDRPRRSQEDAEATALAFSPDGATLVIGDQEGTCYLATANNGWQVRSFPAHEGKISAIKFLPSDQGFLTASYDNTVQEWTADGIRKSGATFPHNDRVVAMDLADDGETIVTAAGSDDAQAVLRVWNRSQPGEPIRSLSLTQIDGDVSGSRSERLMIRSISLHPSEPHALVTIFDPQNSDFPYRVAEWKWQKETESYHLIAGSARQDLSTALFAKHRINGVLTVGGRGARLHSLETSFSPVSMNYRPQSEIRSVSFSADGKKLVSAAEDGSLKIWALDPGTRQWKPDAKVVTPQHAPINAVVFHPSRNDEFLTASDDGTAEVWRLEGNSWETVETMTVPGAQNNEVYSVTYVSGEGDNLQIASAGTAGAYLWGQADEAPRAIGGVGEARCVVSSPDGLWLVVSTGEVAKVYNAKTLLPVMVKSSDDNEEQVTLEGHSAEIIAATFTPDGTRLFTTSRDYTVKLWDIKSIFAGTNNTGQQRELLTLEEHSDEVTSVTATASKDHPFVFTTGLDGQTIVWPNEPLKQ